MKMRNFVKNSDFVRSTRISCGKIQIENGFLKEELNTWLDNVYRACIISQQEYNNIEHFSKAGNTDKSYWNPKKVIMIDVSSKHTKE